MNELEPHVARIRLKKPYYFSLDTSIAPTQSHATTPSTCPILLDARPKISIDQQKHAALQ
jgi:hypothetical protein